MLRNSWEPRHGVLRPILFAYCPFLSPWVNLEVGGIMGTSGQGFGTSVDIIIASLMDSGD